MAKKQRAIKVAASSKKQNLMWGAVLFAILVAAGYVVMGGANQEPVVESAPEIPAPTPVQSKPLPVKDVSTLTPTQKELLQKAREYKLALLTSKTDELKSKSESTTVIETTGSIRSDYVAPQGTPDDIPVDPKGGEYTERSPDTVVRMIIGNESAWLERSGERRQVRVGASAWGMSVSRITPNSVCFGGKKPHCIYIEG